MADSVQIGTTKLCQQCKQIEAAIKIRIEGVGHVLINAKASRMLLGNPAFNMGLAELMLLMVEERGEGVHGRRHNDESSVEVLRFVAEKSSPSSPVA
ncbi:hypothetical protein XarbCFBP7408_21270 [Xanthomonas arboricola pv. guizotiae]|uniref:Uncharacterized protein n=1 Tax=Xanthomonas arboricola pv. guizotiae TaxID=487867 RepID=A0A2S6ZN51_9XANT|nr:hypothetical protein XarbCFBP7409_20730 [Xanthomonas arboricola pv. guizotiae]PPU16893.1 hypothetical protein XarbCFBP7408_21270 [Xanthomonas arboricola pv. guizotiae]